MQGSPTHQCDHQSLPKEIQINVGNIENSVEKKNTAKIEDG